MTNFSAHFRSLAQSSEAVKSGLVPYYVTTVLKGFGGFVTDPDALRRAHWHPDASAGVVAEEPIFRSLVKVAYSDGSIGFYGLAQDFHYWRAMVRRWQRLKVVISAIAFLALSLRWRVLFITLTFRDLEAWQQAGKGKSISRYVKTLRQWLYRHGVEHYLGVWWLEVQRRGVPHYHLLLAVPAVEVPFPDLRQWQWGMSNLKVVMAGGRVVLSRSVRAQRDPIGWLWGYAAKYIGKGGRFKDKAYQVDPEALSVAKGQRKYGVIGWQVLERAGVLPALLSLTYRLSLLPSWVCQLGLAYFTVPEPVRVGKFLRGWCFFEWVFWRYVCFSRRGDHVGLRVGLVFACHRSLFG